MHDVAPPLFFAASGQWAGMTKLSNKCCLDRLIRGDGPILSSYCSVERADGPASREQGLGSIKEMCSEAIWLDKGQLMMHGAPREVVRAYMRFVKVKRSATAMEDM